MDDPVWHYKQSEISGVYMHPRPCYKPSFPPSYIISSNIWILPKMWETNYWRFKFSKPAEIDVNFFSYRKYVTMVQWSWDDGAHHVATVDMLSSNDLGGIHGHGEVAPQQLW